MSRTGVLSDDSVKIHCPEMFPMDNSQYRLLQPLTITKHKLTGIKEDTRFQDYHTFARYPDNDFRNISNILSINNRELAGLRSIVNYRNLVGSKNIPDNVSLEALLNIRFRNAPAPPPAVAAPPPTGRTTSGTSLRQILQGMLPAPAQYDFSITGRQRDAQFRVFRQDIQAGQQGAPPRDIAKSFEADAKVFIGAFPKDTRDDIFAHFYPIFAGASQPAPAPLGGRITAADVRDYLLRQNPNQQQRLDLENLLNDARSQQGQTDIIGGFGAGSSVPAPP